MKINFLWLFFYGKQSSLQACAICCVWDLKYPQTFIPSGPCGLHFLNAGIWWLWRAGTSHIAYGCLWAVCPSLSRRAGRCLCKQKKGLIRKKYISTTNHLQEGFWQVSMRTVKKQEGKVCAEDFTLRSEGHAAADTARDTVLWLSSWNSSFLPLTHVFKDEVYVFVILRSGDVQKFDNVGVVAKFLRRRKRYRSQRQQQQQQQHTSTDSTKYICP